MPAPVVHVFVSSTSGRGARRLRPLLDDGARAVDDVSYTVTGSVENVYAALVVLLGYTSAFTRTDRRQNQAQYEVGTGEVCGFRQMVEREGEVDLVFYFGRAVAEPTRLLFQGLLERFLAGLRVAVTRYPPLNCKKCGYRQQRAEVIQRIRQGRGFMFCSRCGKRINLPKAGEEIVPSQHDRQVVDQEQATALTRTRFEAALVQVKAFVRVSAKKAKPPSCFVSYAWGEPAHEGWVEEQLARDPQNAGVDVILDRWHNAAIGENTARFIGRIEASQAIFVAGTPLYRKKDENKVSTNGGVAAAEVDLINVRLTSTEAQEQTVRPVLLAGDQKKSLPPSCRVGSMPTSGTRNFILPRCST